MWLLSLLRRLAYGLLRSDFNALEARVDVLTKEVKAAQAALHHAVKLTGREDGHQGGNWAVLAYRQGGEDRARLFKFGNRNTGAVQDLLYKFEKAGADARIATPESRKEAA